MAIRPVSYAPVKVTHVPKPKARMVKLTPLKAPKKVTKPATGVTAAAGALGGTPGAPAAPGALPTVRTDYQAQVGRLLSGLGLGGANQNRFVPPTAYQGEITADPEYQLGEQQLAQTRNTLAQQRANAFRQGFISAGFDPGAFQSAVGADPTLRDFAGDIDQGAISAAAANQMSTKAQLDRALADAQAALPYQLAARGAARSGAAATRSSQFQRQYNEQSAQALSSLLDTLRGTAGEYQGGLVEAANRWEQRKAGIAERLAQTQGYSQPTQDWDYDEVVEGLGGLLGTAATPVAPGLAPAPVARPAARPAAPRPKPKPKKPAKPSAKPVARKRRK